MPMMLKWNGSIDSDSDDDGINDGDEVAGGSDPNDSDSTVMVSLMEIVSGETDRLIVIQMTMESMMAQVAGSSDPLNDDLMVMVLSTVMKHQNRSNRSDSDDDGINDGDEAAGGTTQ